MVKTKRNKLAVWTASVCAFGMVMGLVACAPQATEDATEQKADENKTVQQVETPEPDKYGVVTAESWKDAYPDQYASYMENKSNAPLQDGGDKHNYLELYPALNTMYKGYAFALGYDEAASHLYTLQSVKETPRTTQKEQLAGCITCKTPQFTAMVNDEGEGVYKEKFNDLIGEFTEPVSCYNCHENDPQSLKVTGSYFVKALGNDAGEGSKAPMNSQVCGQCHNEYYFAPETKATTNPYTGLEGMTAEAILAYYDEMGFKDWEHTETGAPMLKAQHPEFETIYGGAQSSMAKQGYTCADCHMAPAKAEDGTEYSSHNLVNPTEDPAIMEKCEGCHADLPGQIVQWQKETTDREHELAAKLDAYIKTLAEQKDSLDEATLEQARQIHRHAQFYWDYVMVENSEGAHNPGLAQENLDKCEDELKAGYALLNMAY